MIEFTFWDILRNLLFATRWTVLLSAAAFAGTSSAKGSSFNCACESSARGSVDCESSRTGPIMPSSQGPLLVRFSPGASSISSGAAWTREGIGRPTSVSFRGISGKEPGAASAVAPSKSAWASRDRP